MTSDPVVEGILWPGYCKPRFEEKPGAVSTGWIAFGLRRRMGALAGAAAYASDSEQAHLNSCRKEPGVPVPVIVVSPTVGPEFNGGSVQLEFTVGATGSEASA